MRDRFLIFAGLIVFLALVTFPVWYNLAAGTPTSAPQVKLPVGEKECVAPIAYMKASHMKLLIDWRENRVRNDVAAFAAYNGKRYEVNLTGTCLGACHTGQASQTEFCGKCHDYAGVTPNCWNCHNDPKPANAIPLAPSAPTQVAENPRN